MDLLFTHARSEPTNNQIEQVFDFTVDLPTSVTVTAKSVSAKDAQGEDVTSTLITSSSLSTPEITVNISTLTVDQDYIVIAKATGSDNKTYTQTLLLQVIDPSVFA